MKNKNETKIFTIIRELLITSGLVSKRDSGLQMVPLTGDGSCRKFWRVVKGETSLCLAVAPPNDERCSMAEAYATHTIGRHLHAQNIPVAQQYGWHGDSGIVLFEDFGDDKLHDFVLRTRSENGRKEQILEQYQRVLHGLVIMQIQGANAFDTTWCWDTPYYDKQLMVTKESGYFLRAFWKGFLGREEPAGIKEEFLELGSQAARIPADYFLHRDFQSRNIMIRKNKPHFIDYQGGRLGPLAYDLASLLLDPYVKLQYGLQEQLLKEYVSIMQKYVGVEPQQFLNEYKLLALHRNLQIVGAFSFLVKQRGKPFFQQFLQPAIDSLQRLLDDSFFSSFPIVKKCAQVSGQLLRK